MNTSKTTFKDLLRYAFFPLIMGSNIFILILAVAKNWNLGSSFTYLLITNLIVLFFLEKGWVFKKEWDMSFSEFLRDFAYFGFNGLLDTGVKLGMGYLVISYTAPTQSMPLWASTLSAILVVEFFGYWYHRLGHLQHFLWKIHSIHHVPDKVNLLNNNTTNFLNIVFGTTIKLLPLVLLNFCQEAVFIAVSLTTIHSFVVHVNADIKGGFLGHIFFTPEHHRLHHSTDMHEAQNFGVLLTVWDRLFGTYLYKDGLVPKEVGVMHPENYPKPFEVIKGFLFPFSKKQLW